MATMTPPARRTPPGPRGHWLFGSVGRLRSDPLGLYKEAQKEYGDVVRFRATPGFSWYLVLHPADVEHVLQKRQANYPKGATFNRSVGVLAGQGILTSEGDFW